MRTIRTLFAATLLSAAAIAIGGGAATAPAASIGQIQQQIAASQSKVSALSGALNTTSGHLDQLNSSVAAMQQRIAGVQASLRSHEMELFAIAERLTAARNKLHKLEAFEKRGEQTLARQLVNSYESDRPDLVSVVLQATGFQNLLERLAFANRVEKQNVQIVNRVRAARRAVAAQAVHLGSLEVRQRAVTLQIQRARNALLSSETTLLRQRLAVAQVRSRQAGQLASARNQVAGLQHQLSQAQAAQAAQAAQQSAPSSPTSSFASAPPAGPVSSSGFVFPLPKGSASPPSTWSLDQGVDIAAPGNTPEYAVCSGTIVLHGIGGFGPWAPVLHCDSPLDGYDYVYYGHAGPQGQLAVGTHVGAGQVMSSIGPGIVGMSTGPHIEIGFADSAGSPIGGSSASTMLALLQGSY